jgi:hypothetical protein
MQTSVKQTALDEDRIIRALENLPNRSARLFSRFVDDCLKKYFLIKSVKDLAAIIGKTDEQVRNRAKCLGLRRLG